MNTFIVVYRNKEGRELRRICNTQEEANAKAAQLRADKFKVLSVGPIAYADFAAPYSRLYPQG